MLLGLQGGMRGLCTGPLCGDSPAWSDKSLFQVFEQVRGPVMYSGPASLSMEDEAVAFLQVLPGSSQSFDLTLCKRVAKL